MHKILITGGRGFIGSHLVKKVAERDYKIYIVDNLDVENTNTNKNIKALQSDHNKISIYKEDLRNKKGISYIFDHEKIDTCIHLAAKTDVLDSIKNPYYTFDVNIKGTLNLLEACSNNKVKNFIFASSASVYGEALKLPISEDHILEPLSPYGASKVAGEVLVSTYRKLGKIKNAISLRLFNVYGEGQSLEYAGVIKKFAGRLSRHLPPIIYGDGKQTRDFVSVHDVVNAIMLASELEVKIQPSMGVFNVGTGIPTSISNLAQQMIRISSLNLQPVYELANKAEIMNSYADITRAKNILKFIPKCHLETDLKNLIDSVAIKK
jgi:UDP-glucose 4-epimerase